MRICAANIWSQHHSGAIPLHKLRPSDMEGLVLVMRAKTKKKTSTANGELDVRALPDSTICQAYTILRAGLDGAVRDGLLARNPAALVKRPGVERCEARHLDADDVAAIIDAAEASAITPPWCSSSRPGFARARHWDVFCCQHCTAVPELLVDGKAQLAIVRHALGCPTLLAQVRNRWPDELARLPDTPAQTPFEHKAAFGRRLFAVRLRSGVGRCRR